MFSPSVPSSLISAAQVVPLPALPVAGCETMRMNGVHSEVVADPSWYPVSQSRSRQSSATRLTSSQGIASCTAVLATSFR